MKFFVLLLAACNPNAPCRSLELGQDAGPLPSWDGGGLAGPSETPLGDDFNEGPAAEQYCCAFPSDKSGKCAEFDCSLPENTGVTVKNLGRPYHYEYGSDSWQSCIISEREGRITAIWSVKGG